MARMVVDLSDEQLMARFGSPMAQRALVEAMARTFQPSLAFGFEGRVVFELTGMAARSDASPSLSWTIEIRPNRAVVLRGAAPDAAASVRISVPSFVRLLAGELTPVGALVQRKVTASGDVVLASRMAEMFGGVNPLEST